MAKGWLKAIAEHTDLAAQIRIVGLVDLNIEMAEALAEEFELGDAKCGTDLAAMLEETDAELLFDIVVPPARMNVVTTGLERGCHVLSEKPMAPSLEQAREMIALAEKVGRIHAIVQNRRYIPGVRRLRAFVESGAIGALTGVHCDFFIGAHFGGFREDMDNVLLLDMAVHTLDAARFMAGKTPLAVYCHESNPRGSWYRTGSAANAIFEFSDDVVFTYRGSWVAEGANTSWESAWRFVGSKGTILWDGAEGFEAKVSVGTDGFLRDVASVEIPEPAEIGQTHGHASVIAEFLNAIESGRAPETASDDNIKSLAMVFAAIESAKTRQRVTIAV
jgi:predicted dehydrogenase